MKRRWASLLTVAMLVVAFSVPMAAQQETVAEVRAMAEQGDAFAQYNVGFMYANGLGVPQDDAEAVRWYRLAADQGNADAQVSTSGSCMKMAVASHRMM